MNYPQNGPRRLRRSRNDRWVGGVCGGLAEYLNMDATLVRVAVVIIALVTAAIPVAAIYVLMMLLIPEADSQQPGSLGPAPRYRWQSQQPGQQNTWQPGQQQQPQQSDPVWGQAGPPWSPNPTVDTSAPQPPRQSAEDLFSRAKHPGQPSNSAQNSSAQSESGQNGSADPAAEPTTEISSEPTSEAATQDDKPEV